MSKREIKNLLEKMEEFEDRFFSLSKREKILLSKMKPKEAIQKLKRARILIELGSSFKTAKEDEEFIQKDLRPILFDKSTTKKFVETMIMIKEGLLIEVPPILIIFNKVFPQIQKFSKMFPQNVELTEEDSEKELIITVKIKLSKKLLEVKSSKETIEQLITRKRKRKE